MVGFLWKQSWGGVGNKELDHCVWGTSICLSGVTMVGLPNVGLPGKLFPLFSTARGLPLGVSPPIVKPPSLPSLPYPPGKISCSYIVLK